MLYFALPQKWRWILLLIASYYFYMCWKVEYIFLIIFSTLIDYWCSLQMGKRPDKAYRRKFLMISLFTNLGLLFSFKYFNFVNGAFRELFHHYNLFYNVPAFNVLLPVGISFYTFQTLSYTINVYRGEKEAEKHLGIFALYVSFFPQLVAGPIERSTRLLPQFYRKFDFNTSRVVSGLQLMLWGFFKKLVVADRLSTYVNAVYNNQSHHNGTSFTLATIFFAFQIYCDFSAYSDIAIGSARVMGYDLMDNFRRPYFARTIREFWSRWHISLSTWFRDYLYIPLGGNRVVKWRWYYNLMITFVISGLWHGANWTFIVWGFLHGFFLVFALWSMPVRNRIIHSLRLDRHLALSNFINIPVTFFLVCVGWIFFRANNITDAFSIVYKIFTDPGHLFIGSYSTVVYGFIGILLLLGVEFEQEYKLLNLKLFNNPNVAIRYASYTALILLILLIGVFDGSQFIYFQF